MSTLIAVSETNIQILRKFIHELVCFELKKVVIHISFKRYSKQKVTSF